MPAPVSTVPAVRAWLVAQFTAAVSGITEPAVEVYQSAEDHESTADVVIVEGAQRTLGGFEMVGGGGAGWLQESFTIGVSIECFVHGERPFPDVDDRAYLILGLLEQAVRADPSLGGLVIVGQPAGSTSTHATSADGGHCDIAAQFHFMTQQ
jgi:hypothetical protein